MAHELSTTADGNVQFMYKGEKPWHSLGTAVDHALTSAEALEAAHMDYTYSKREIITADGLDVKDFKAIVRDDTNKVMSVQTNSYEILQPYECFAFSDALIGMSGARYETAGVLFSGKKIFMTAKMSEQIEVAANDLIDQYLVFATSYDGSMATTAYFTPVRVVCNNTLRASLGSIKSAYKFRHTIGMERKLEEAKQALGLSKGYFAKFTEVATMLRQKLVDKAGVEAFLKTCFEIAPLAEPTRFEVEGMDAIRRDFNEDPKNNLPGMEGSVWSLWNSSAQWADHESRAVSKSADKRFNSIFWGSAGQFKERAFEAAMALAK